MLPRPETDLKPDLPRRRGKSRACGQRFRRDRKERQRFGEQALLAGAKRLAPTASVEPANRRRTVRSAVRHHRLRWARSGESAQRIREIGLFPGKTAVGFRRAAEMTICRRASEDRMVQVEVLA